MKYIRWMEDKPISKDNVGNKFFNLVWLQEQGVSVPKSFVIIIDAYLEFMERNDLVAKIKSIYPNMDPGHGLDYDEISNEIISLFKRAHMWDDLINEIVFSYHQLCEINNQLPVAVRSSAINEDGDQHSYAGQFDTYLGVIGHKDLLEKVVDCWASLFTQRAISYSNHKRIASNPFSMAVIVQEMIYPICAGIMLTVDPVKRDVSQAVIESALGLGVGVVDNVVSPDRYYIDKVTYEIRSKDISPKKVAYRINKDVGGVVSETLDSDLFTSASLSDEEAIHVAKEGRKLEKRIGFPIDLEWAIGNSTNQVDQQLFFLQVRPETTWNIKHFKTVPHPYRHIIEEIYLKMTRLKGG